LGSLRDIIKNAGITQQELADYLGITRQYLNNYLDETNENALMPEKYFSNVLFLFNCKNREELYNLNMDKSPKVIKKRLNIIVETKIKVDELFSIDNEKLELFKMIDYLNKLVLHNPVLLEAFYLLINNLSKNENYLSLLTFTGKKHLLINFDDVKYDSERCNAREALLYKALESNDLDFLEYKDLYEQFKNNVQGQTEIDITALKQSLVEMGFNNLDDLEMLEIINKYEKLKDKKQTVM
jgi:transcriptional regulator with XRE-family HTH domain